MELIDKLKMHSSDSKLALLIRHGDREQIPNGEFGNEILLNEKGKQNSIALGKSLREFPVRRILTSPIPRCVQTAEFISKGYGSSLEIIETKSLGAPGLHIADEKIAGECFLKYGLDGMYQRFTKGEIIPGIPDAKELHYRISTFIQETANQDGITIFVTHDMLIAFCHYSLSKKVYSKDNWINYLDGLIYKIEEKQ